MYILTFYDSAHSQALQRTRAEALSMGVEHVFACNEFNLGREFLQQHGNFIRSNRRGWGYWLWKPWLILKTLDRIPEGSVLAYIDGGCEILPSGKQRFLEYGELARNDKGLFAFTLEEGRTQGRYCKQDTMERIGGDEDSPQCKSGTVIVMNCPAARDFILEWYEHCGADHYRYLDDSPSALPNHPEFIEHRHDQAIFSLLVYRDGIPVIPDESWWPGTWEENTQYPIHARRRRK